MIGHRHFRIHWLVWMIFVLPARGLAEPPGLVERLVTRAFFPVENAWDDAVAWKDTTALRRQEQSHGPERHGSHSMPPEPTHETHEHGGMGGMVEMRGLDGPYRISRESSGTAWQPESASHDAFHTMRGAWMLMLHGFGDLVYTDQGGRRGDEKFFSSNMVMGIGRRSFGRGTLGVRAMFSAEPSTIGRKGYPLLLQSGETADGRTPLIDAQHPHDAFMELAVSYSVACENNSGFLYFGLPGEPALGPPAFMHRFSGMANPEAPITHHWLDSTHITYGVATAGLVIRRWKLEGSIFTGREPDQHRYGWDTPKFDSRAVRLSWNPTASWSLQGSIGRLKSPEQLEPEIDTDRSTVSAIYHRNWKGNRIQSTFAWGRNDDRPGKARDGWLAEGAAEVKGRHTLFARAERVDKAGLSDEEGSADRVFTVGRASAGYAYDLLHRSVFAVGIGGSVSAVLIPRPLEVAYGKDPRSATGFVRLRVRGPESSGASSMGR